MYQTQTQYYVAQMKQSVSQYFKSNSIVITCAFDDQRSDQSVVAAIFHNSISGKSLFSITSHPFPRLVHSIMVKIQHNFFHVVTFFGIKQVIFSASLKNRRKLCWHVFFLYKSSKIKKKYLHLNLFLFTMYSSKDMLQ